MDRMCITEAVRAKNTTEAGTAFIGVNGRTLGRLPADTESSNDTATAEFEILRGDLADIITSAAGIAADIRYNERVTAVVPADNGVEVTFSSGSEQRFDVLIAADGLRSATRAMVLGEQITPIPLGLQTSYFTIERRPDDDNDWRWYAATGSRSITLRPDPYGTIRATVSYIESDAETGRRRALNDQKQHLREVFRGAGWQTERVLDGMDRADDFYYESLAQVRLQRPWWRNRMVLVGDAAYCASPLSGMGTSLALVGAYVLAGELTTQRRPEDAFTAYERIMRPYVDKAQKLPPGGPRLAHPRTRVGVRVFNGIVALLLSRPLRSLAAKLTSPPADNITPPFYPAFATNSSSC
jgi:2-polyprenyl-6-methoxyphenol hydroxylase-like FAD-dependent oxidoreductase